ncbi:MAG: cupin domain-containing protein [Dongiaceae bacterium]
MPNELREGFDDKPLDELHREAEAKVQTFRYKRPDQKEFGSKGLVRLGRGEIIRSVVQIVKQKGGENNLHYHTHVETLWWVIKGRVRFYGPNDAVIGEFGPNEGVITPRYSRYWFENAESEDLELLQVAASDTVQHKSGRTDVAPRPAALKITVLREESAGPPAGRLQVPSR